MSLTDLKGCGELVERRVKDRPASRPELPIAIASDVGRVTQQSRSLASLAAAAINRAIELRQSALAARARRAVARRDRMLSRRTDDMRDRLAAENLPLARQLAARFTGRGQPFEDLYQVACLGLVKAAERFDPVRGVRFRTYAQAVISGELKRYFRDHGWGLHVARPVQEMFLAVRGARESLTHRLGRPPTVQEMAAELATDEESVIEALNAGDTFYLESVDAPLPGDESARREVAIEETGFVNVEERSWLVPAIEQLTERDRLILQLRFFEGMSQSQIASRIGISQMHVSRLLTRALARLRESSPDAHPAPRQLTPSANRAG